MLAVGAQSSLTGGATPLGDIVLSTDRLNTISIMGDRVRAGAGVPLQTLQDELAQAGRWFPPVPTYLGAFAGGAVATCAAGAATFNTARCATGWRVSPSCLPAATCSSCRAVSIGRPMAFS